MSPAVSIFLLLAAVALIGAAAFLDHEGYTRPAIGVAGVGLAVFFVMLCTVDAVDWGMDPAPAPARSPSPSATRPAAALPSYDPETCMDLAWLDERWTCIPREEAG